jgi:sugar transferase (PEP-CTERM system associated)
MDEGYRLMSSLKYRYISSDSKSLAIIEFLLFSGTLLCVVYFDHYRHFIQDDLTSNDFLLVYAIVFALVVQLSCLALGLYNSKLRENYLGLLRRICAAIAIGFFIIVMINALYKNMGISIDLLAVICLASFVVVSVFRYLTLHIDFFGFNKRRVVVLGTGRRASIIETRMRRDVDRQCFDVVGFIAMQGDAEKEVVNEKIITLETSLVAYILSSNIAEIVVANDERRNNLPVDELFACKVRGIEVTEILDFIERETGQIAVNLIYPSWIIYSTGFASSNHLRKKLDWAFNTGMALLLFMLTWPVMLLTALLIKMEDGLKAPVFYYQTRVGVDGETFDIVKFRSMRIDAEKAGAQWAKTGDSRTTRIGDVIRKYRIDELPQIYNVLLGEMGFVGPRPERPEFVEQLIKAIPYYNERHTVKPGLTGWAQLKYPYGATEQDALEKLKYDLYYIKHRSFLLDCLILIQTVEVVSFGKGR